VQEAARVKTKRVRVEREDGRVVCESCVVADTPIARLIGLTGRRRLACGEGLLLRPVNAIHTSFMRFAIDAVFLDRELAVVRIAENVRPWRFAGRRGARAVLELGAGECARLGLRREERLRVV
jgi:uncharacterized membrane protein (UPF0127 family)